MNALRQQEQELQAGKEQIVDVLNRIEEEKVRIVVHSVNHYSTGKCETCLVALRTALHY